MHRHLPVFIQDYYGDDDKILHALTDASETLCQIICLTLYGMQDYHSSTRGQKPHTPGGHIRRPTNGPDSNLAIRCVLLLQLRVEELCFYRVEV